MYNILQKDARKSKQGSICAPFHILSRITVPKQCLCIDQPMNNKFTKGEKERCP